ncbi:MAG: hypothetical protein Q4B63_08275 [Clostridium perfringens]|nr:hypothetical protein [Clostridium perfringens]
MKYTRYDLNIKKRKNERKKMLVSILSVIVIALVVGVGLYKFIILPTMGDGSINKLLSNEGKGTGTNGGDNLGGGNQDGASATAPLENDSNKEAQQTNTTVTQSGGKEDYIMIQCGVYSKEDGAKTVLSELQKVALGTIIEEDGKYRVVSYIGSESEGDSIVTTLESNNITTSKAKFSIVKSDNCNNKIAEMLNGYIQILNKLDDEGVSGVKTAEFKEWTNALEEDTNDTNVSVFKELKENINALGEEITKNDLESAYNAIYKVLINFKA